MSKLVAIVFAAVLIMACGNGTKQSAEVQVDSLRMAISKQDTALNAIFESLNQIVLNLHNIKERENVIAAAVAQEDGYQVRMIAADIDVLDSLLLVNKETITKLYGNARELKNSKVYVASLESLIDDLTEQVDRNDSQIVALKRELEAKTEQVGTLSHEVAGLSRRSELLAGEVRAASSMLNKAYYVVDSQKNLLKNNIIYKSGFVGRTIKVNENCSLDAFVMVDVRSFDHVQIDGQDPVLVSSHPDASYRLERDSYGVLWLNVIDAELFWKYTKVLVVAYK